VQFGESYDWRDAARPMPFGLSEGDDGEPAGETFEWALATDDCGDCTFYEEETGGQGACTVHDARPLICQTYPFSVALDGTSQPMGEAVDAEGAVRAHECEGLGRDISREDAEALAAALKRARGPRTGGGDRRPRRLRPDRRRALRRRRGRLRLRRGESGGRDTDRRRLSDPGDRPVTARPPPGDSHRVQRCVDIGGDRLAPPPRREA